MAIYRNNMDFNRAMAMKLFKKGWKPDQIARAWPAIWKVKGGKLGSKVPESTKLSMGRIQEAIRMGPEKFIGQHGGDAETSAAQDVLADVAETLEGRKSPLAPEVDAVAFAIDKAGTVEAAPKSRDAKDKVTIKEIRAALAGAGPALFPHVRLKTSLVISIAISHLTPSHISTILRRVLLAFIRASSENALICAVSVQDGK